MSPAALVIEIFLAFYALQLLVEAGLLALHLRRAARARGVPATLEGKIAAETAERSRAYTLARGRFAFVSMGVSAAVTLLALLSGVLPWLERTLSGLGLGGANLFAAFLAALALASAVIDVPLSLHGTFVIEARFGFNRTTPRLWVVDRLKGLAIAAAIGIPLLYASYALVRFTGPLWWVWLFTFLAAFQVAMLWAIPIFIMPRFNRFEPLPEGPLRQRLTALAEEAGFRNRGLFVMDASRRSAHSNALFAGLFRPRIILFDTLIERMSVDEAASVLAHEIGHFREHHVERMLAVSLAGLLAILAVLSRLLPWPPLYAAFGFPAPSLHAAVALLALGGGAFVFWLTPIASFFSRRHEYQADRYAVRLARAPAALKSALLRLGIDSLGNLHPHPWYSAWHYSHPVLVERLEAIDRIGAA
jgi:STE24 endopeptidase